MSRLTQLEDLQVGSSAIKSLEGLESLTRLKTLSLNNNTKLSSLQGIGVGNQLITLAVDSCKNLKSITEIASFSNLETLEINNCGDIESFKPIANLKRLKRLRFVESTNIVDGDISPCVGIKEVYFQNRKHYSHSNEEINRMYVRR